MFELIAKNDVKTLSQWLSTNPDAVHIRSEDGRGPVWWAREYQRTQVLDLLKHYKVRTDLADAGGKLPV